MADDLIIPGTQYVDLVGWDPLIMKFCELFGDATQLHPSRLASGWLSDAASGNQPLPGHAAWHSRSGETSSPRRAMIIARRGEVGVARGH